MAGNNAPASPNIYTDSAGFFFGVNNVINGNPLPAPLDNYGGPTPTMPPLHGSPAIDAGRDSITNFLATDQVKSFVASFVAAFSGGVFFFFFFFST